MSRRARCSPRLLRTPSFADFPRTLDQRVYHLGLRAGEVANRIVRAPAVVLPAMRDWPFLRTLPTLTLTLTTDTQITLGTPSRAHATASYLDPLPAPFTLTSERGFTTITGRYRGVPVSSGSSKFERAGWHHTRSTARWARCFSGCCLTYQVDRVAHINAEDDDGWQQTG